MPSMDSTTNSLSTFESGMLVEEQSFVWKIKSFPVVLKDDTLINWQKMNFSTGKSLNLTSQWTLYLACKIQDGGRWIGIFYKIKSGPSAPCTELYTHCHVSIKDKDGNASWDGDMGVHDTLSLRPGEGFGFQKMIKDDSTLSFLVDDTLVIHANFKIYSRSNPAQLVEAAVKEFQVKTSAKALADIADFLKSPDSSEETVKIISKNDGKGFAVQKGVIAVRSPGLKELLETNTVEGSDGEIQLPDISSATLHVIVHFLCKGEFLPEWSSPEIIFELTEAAAQYQIEDLLEFLDSMLGKVCTLDNVVGLLALAIQFNLKTAEADLLRYVSNEGASSSDNLFEILKSVSVENPAVQGRKRRHSGGDSNVSGSEEKKSKYGGACSVM